MAKTLVRVSWVSHRLDVSPSKVYEMVNAGLLPVIRVGHSIRFDPELIEQWVRDGGNNGNPGSLALQAA